MITGLLQCTVAVYKEARSPAFLCSLMVAFPDIFCCSLPVRLDMYRPPNVVYMFCPLHRNCGYLSA